MRDDGLSLYQALRAVAWPHFIAQVPALLLSEIFTLICPFLLKKILDVLTSEEGDMSAGLFFCGLLLVARLVLGWTFWGANVGQSVTRMVLSQTLWAEAFQKALRLPEGTMTSGEIINLMDFDVDKLSSAPRHIHAIWTNTLKVAGSFAVLFYLLGPAAFVGLVILTVLVPINRVVFSKNEEFWQAMGDLGDARVAEIGQVLAGIRIIKLSAWEAIMSSRVTRRRVEQLKELKKIRLVEVLVEGMWELIPNVITITTFAVFCLQGNDITPSIAFSALSVFSMMNHPFIAIPYDVLGLMEGRASARRLKAFFDLRELPRNQSDGILAKPGVAAEVVNATFAWPSHVTLKRGEDATQKEPRRKKDSNDEATRSLVAATSSDEDSAAEDRNLPVALSTCSLDIRRGEVVAVVGALGAGKSALLASLLGETVRVAGAVAVESRRVAYVPQAAWIQNATVRDNILFGRPYDGARYARVVDACALRPDLAALPAGDGTEIGEKGVNLSGGQKQRVSLARACYSDADTLFLDDPLSAVDTHCARHIFEKCILGLLKGKTIVLVTHHLHCLPHVDTVVVLDKGRVVEQGTYAELTSPASGGEGGGEGHLAAVLAEVGFTADHVEATTVFTAAETETETEAKSDTAGETEPPANGCDVATTEVGANAAAGKLTEETDLRQEGAVSRDAFAAFLTIGGVPLLVSIVLMTAVARSFDVLCTLWLSKWSESGDPSKAMYYIRVYSALVVALAAASVARHLLQIKHSLLASQRFHDRLLAAVLAAPVVFFEQTPVGRILSRFSKDIEKVDDAISWRFREFLTSSIIILGCMAVIGMFAPLGLLSVLPAVLLMRRVVAMYRVTVRDLMRVVSTASGPIKSFLVEACEGMATLRAYNVRSRFEGEMANRLDAQTKSEVRMVEAEAYGGVMINAISSTVAVATCAAALVSARYLGIKGSLAAVAVSNALILTNEIGWLVNNLVFLESNMVSVERLMGYINLEPEESVHVAGDGNKSGLDDVPSVTFKNATFRYRAGLPLALDDVSFHVRPGERLAIVGRSGSGKSTITNCLFRTRELSSGAIYIGSHGIDTVPLHDLRSTLSIVPQDAFLFSGTLRQNLDPHGRADDAALWRALDDSGLGGTVRNLEGGLDYVLEENGGNLSAGQRQLVCLARAILRRAKILVLDEATASCDAESDATIQTAIRKAFAGCTILTIAHRLNTVVDYDRVMVLSRGRVVEAGAPHALLADPSSAFSAMVDEQGPAAAAALRDAAAAATAANVPTALSATVPPLSCPSAAPCS